MFSNAEQLAKHIIIWLLVHSQLIYPPDQVPQKNRQATFCSYEIDFFIGLVSENERLWIRN